jgi:hypothetical protein
LTLPPIVKRSPDRPSHDGHEHLGPPFRLLDRGVAGSRLVLNPRQVREDLKPFRLQASGMPEDTLDEPRIAVGAGTVAASRPSRW